MVISNLPENLPEVWFPFIAGIVEQSIPAILSQIFLSESLAPEWGRVILYLRGVQWVLLPSV